MIFTSVKDADSEVEYLINLEQLCYIKKEFDDGTYELWFTQEKGLGLNAITIDRYDAEKIFSLIKEYARHLEGTETELR